MRAPLISARLPTAKKFRSRGSLLELPELTTEARQRRDPLTSEIQRSAQWAPAAPDYSTEPLASRRQPVAVQRDRYRDAPRELASVPGIPGTCARRCARHCGDSSAAAESLNQRRWRCRWKEIEGRAPKAGW